MTAIIMVTAFTSTAIGREAQAKLVRVDVFKDGAKGKPAGVANCSNDTGASSGLYELTGWTVGSATAHLNAATVPAGLGDVEPAMQASFDALANAAAGVPHITVSSDGTVTKAKANRVNDLLFGRTGGSIATTYTWRWTDGQVESDVVFNLGLGWFRASGEGDGCVENAGAKYDLENIAVHEFGHVYGLGHAPDSRFETMYAYGYTGETLKRSPAGGDVAGLRALYQGGP